MKFVQYYLDCLSQASYLIGDENTGRAAIVDPRRDVAEYLADAEAAGLAIEYAIETHVHADFLSGHLELAEATGATIIYGAAANVSFPHRKVADRERISLGDVTLEFRATPGHTPESVSVVVWEGPDASEPYGVLTGDTLFIGDVGRPDLLSAGGRTPESMARQLYESLHTQLLTLPDTTRVFPAHGAGSACGKNLSTETSSTMGEQRRDNYALRLATVEEFVEAVTEGQPPAPEYFALVASLNADQHGLLHPEEPPLLTLAEVLALQSGGAVVLDVRPPAAFAQGHLAGSINVGLEGRFAEYAGEMIDLAADVVLVCDPGQARESRVRLARVGLDRVVGALDQPEAEFPEHPEAIQVASRVTATQLASAMDDQPDLVLVDVRGSGEREMGRIDPSEHLAMPELRARLAELDPARPHVIYCASGYRSMIAASLMRARGFGDVSDLLGGFQAWVASNATAA
jgi:glyoxylase-like metal-dependent hydrolase (beta-lactamase superfamily II)/rhodanese-related sulfurtransferase